MFAAIRESARSFGLNEFGSRVDWFKNDKFLKDLEGDSVDTEILDEELRSLQDDEEPSCRGRTVRFLECNPLQIVLCVLVLVDAGVVVTEILLDLHAIRGQYLEAENQLVSCLSFIKAQYAEDLGDYNGNKVDVLLNILREKYPYNETEIILDGHDLHKRSVDGLVPPGDWGFTQPPDSGRPSDYSPDSTFTIYHLQGSGAPLDIESSFQDTKPIDRKNEYFEEPADPTTEHSKPDQIMSSHMSGRSGSGQMLSEKGMLQLDRTGISGSDKPRTSGSLSGDHLLSHVLIVGSSKTKSSLSVESAQFPSAQSERSPLKEGGKRTRVQTMHTQDYRPEGAENAPQKLTNIGYHQHQSRNRESENRITQRGHTDITGFHLDRQKRNIQADLAMLEAAQNRVKRGGGYDTKQSADNNDTKKEEYYGHTYSHQYTKSKMLLKIAHILHYISIAILGVFVVQVLLKIYGMGAEFFHKKMEIFDAVIIVASFLLDIVFLDGVGPDNMDEAAALVILFLLWRLLRVINGIMVTAKQRQEFRIKLQKRARRRAEKKIEILEEDRQYKDKEIANLHSLCKLKGIAESELNLCKPRRRHFSQKNTSTGLSSIAAMSLGFTMSMSGGNLMNNTAESRRASMDMFGPGGFAYNRSGGASRRPSTVSRASTDSLPQLFALPDTSKKPERTPGPMIKSIERVSMERVLEEGSESPTEDKNQSQNDSEVKIVKVERSPRLEKRKAKPNHLEINGDAIHAPLDDLMEDDEENSNTSPTCTNISIHVNPCYPSSSSDNNNERGLGDNSPTKPLVPPRAAVICREVPNGPITIATSPLGSGHLETQPDHITWFRRHSHETDDIKDTSVNKSNELTLDPPLRSSSMTALSMPLERMDSKVSSSSNSRTPSPRPVPSPSW